MDNTLINALFVYVYGKKQRPLGIDYYFCEIGRKVYDVKYIHVHVGTITAATLTSQCTSYTYTNDNC